MAKTEVTAVQVQMAASAGVKLLQVEDLPVPMVIAKSGALSVLEGMLQALANGEVVLAQAPQAEVPLQVADPAANDGGGAPPVEE